MAAEMAGDEAAADGEGEALIAGDEEIVAASEEAVDAGDMGMDLMAAFDESDIPEVAKEAGEVDHTGMMAVLIDETIAANKGKGDQGEGAQKQMVCDLERTYYKDLKNAMTDASMSLHHNAVSGTTQTDAG